MRALRVPWKSSVKVFRSEAGRKKFGLSRDKILYLGYFLFLGVFILRYLRDAF